MTNATDPTGLARFYEQPTHANLAAVTEMWKRQMVDQASRSLPHSYRVLEVVSLGDRTIALLARTRQSDGATTAYATFRVCPDYSLEAKRGFGTPRVCLENGRYDMNTLARAAENFEARLEGHPA